MNTELIAQTNAKAAYLDERCWFFEAESIRELVDALEAAQLAREPVAWMHVDGFAELAAGKSQIVYPKPANMGYAPLHRRPAPQVPMTDKEIAGAWISIADPVALGGKFNGSDAVRDFVRAVEAHHGIGVKP